MISVKRVLQLDELAHLKEAYFRAAKSPLDGMWHMGFVPMAAHYGIYENQHLVGFCCVNDDGFLLQFYLKHKQQMVVNEVFSSIVNGTCPEIGQVKGAFVSTAEPEYQSLCLDNSSECVVNAFMYQYDNVQWEHASEGIELTLAPVHQLDALVEFAVDAIGAPKEWLTGYYTNLINREELWFYSQAGVIIAAGECRRFDQYQTEYADLGMIVAPTHRNQGVATKVLSSLVKTAQQQGLKPICSTESENTAAQRAISKAGFMAPNRIVKFIFCRVQ